MKFFNQAGGRVSRLERRRGFSAWGMASLGVLSSGLDVGGSVCDGPMLFRAAAGVGDDGCPIEGGGDVLVSVQLWVGVAWGAILSSEIVCRGLGDRYGS